MSKEALNDEILIVDLESTCWDNDQPADQTSDIIEIGVAHLNRKTLQVTNNWTVKVIPTRSTITPFSERLNGITVEDIKLVGVPLAEAFSCLVTAKSRQRTWASYGNYDRRKIDEDARTFRLRYPMSPRHINVKTLLAVVLDLPREIGMDEALKLLGLPLMGRHHSGKDDAFNIAKILGWILAATRSTLIKTIAGDGSIKYAP